MNDAFDELDQALSTSPPPLPPPLLVSAPTRPPPPLGARLLADVLAAVLVELARAALESELKDAQ